MPYRTAAAILRSFTGWQPADIGRVFAAFVLVYNHPASARAFFELTGTGLSPAACLAVAAAGDTLEVTLFAARLVGPARLSRFVAAGVRLDEIPDLIAFERLPDDATLATLAALRGAPDEND